MISPIAFLRDQETLFCLQPLHMLLSCTLLGFAPSAFRWPIYANIQRLECMCCVRWQTEQNYTKILCKPDQLQINVRGMAIHEEDYWPSFQGAGCSRQEQLFEPLKEVWRFHPARLRYIEICTRWSSLSPGGPQILSFV